MRKSRGRSLRDSLRGKSVVRKEKATTVTAPLAAPATRSLPPARPSPPAPTSEPTPAPPRTTGWLPSPSTTRRAGGAAFHRRSPGRRKHAGPPVDAAEDAPSAQLLPPAPSPFIGDVRFEAPEDPPPEPQDELPEDSIDFFEGGRLDVGSPFPAILRTFAATVELVVGGDEHFLAISANRTLFAWGSGSKGQLGLGSFDSAEAPSLVKTLPVGGVVHAAACGEWSAAVTSDGNLYVWGSNGFEGTPNLPVHTTKVLKDKRGNRLQAAKVALGRSHIVVLTTTHKVFSWGANLHNVLLNPNIPVSAFRAAPGGKPTVDKNCRNIACGPYSTAVITDKYRVLFWGKSLNTELEDYVAKALRIENPPGASYQVVGVAVGSSHMVACTRDGVALAVGSNSHGQLGTGEAVGAPVTYTWRTVSATQDELPAARVVLSRASSGVASGEGGSSSTGGVSRSHSWNDLRGKMVNKRGSRRKPGAARVRDPHAIRCVAACGETSAALTVNGSMLLWGKHEDVDKLAGQRLSRAPEQEPMSLVPRLVSQLVRVQMQRLYMCPKGVLACVGLENKPSIMFGSFVPPVPACGTPEALAAWLWNPKRSAEFMRAFLLHFDQFMKPMELCALMKGAVSAITHLPSSDGHVKVMVEVVTTWLQSRSMFARDMLADESVRAMLQDIVAELKDHSPSLQQLLDAPHVPREPLKPFQDELPPYDWRAHSAKQLATQLTVLASKSFCSMCVDEFLHLNWQNEDMSLAPILREHIDHFNRLHSWATTAIVVAPTHKERSYRANFLVDVLSECVALHNYSSSRILAAALCSVAVNKLKRHQALRLKAKNETTLQQFQSMWMRNSAEYRSALAAALDQGLPLVPYVGCHLTDLTMISHSAKAWTDKEARLFNANRMCQLEDQIAYLLQLQRAAAGYSLAREEPLLSQLLRVSGLPEPDVDKRVADVVVGLGGSASASPARSAERSVLGEDLESQLNASSFEEDPLARSALWRFWIASLQSTNATYIGRSGTNMSFKDVFLKCDAVANIVFNVLANFPVGEAALQFRALLEHSLDASYAQHLDAFVGTLRFLSRMQLPSSLRSRMGHVVAAFRPTQSLVNITPWGSLALRVREHSQEGWSSKVEQHVDEVRKQCGKLGLALKLFYRIDHPLIVKESNGSREEESTPSEEKGTPGLSLFSKLITELETDVSQLVAHGNEMSQIVAANGHKADPSNRAAFTQLAPKLAACHGRIKENHKRLTADASVHIPKDVAVYLSYMKTVMTVMPKEVLQLLKVARAALDVADKASLSSMGRVAQSFRSTADSMHAVCVVTHHHVAPLLASSPGSLPSPPLTRTDSPGALPGPPTVSAASSLASPARHLEVCKAALRLVTDTVRGDNKDDTLFPRFSKFFATSMVLLYRHVNVVDEKIAANLVQASQDVVSRGGVILTAGAEPRPEDFDDAVSTMIHLLAVCRSLIGDQTELSNSEAEADADADAESDASGADVSAQDSLTDRAEEDEEEEEEEEDEITCVSIDHLTPEFVADIVKVIHARREEMFRLMESWEALEGKRRRLLVELEELEQQQHTLEDAFVACGGKECNDEGPTESGPSSVEATPPRSLSRHRTTTSTFISGEMLKMDDTEVHGVSLLMDTLVPKRLDELKAAVELSESISAVELLFMSHIRGIFEYLEKLVTQWPTGKPMAFNVRRVYREMPRLLKQFEPHEEVEGARELNALRERVFALIAKLEEGDAV